MIDGFLIWGRDDRTWGRGGWSWSGLGRILVGGCLSLGIWFVVEWLGEGTTENTERTEAERRLFMRFEVFKEFNS